MQPPRGLPLWGPRGCRSRVTPDEVEDTLYLDSTAPCNTIDGKEPKEPAIAPSPQRRTNAGPQGYMQGHGMLPWPQSASESMVHKARSQDAGTSFAVG